MKQVSIAPEVAAVLPRLQLACLEAEVVVEKSSPELLATIDEIIAEKAALEIAAIRDIPAIATSREAYRALGKEPSRYRLSAEALTRRIVQGKGLYHISNVVEIINAISLQSGYSIGGYDADAISGSVQLTKGRADDDYEAIGRGSFNIENLPAFRDELGAFGTPTSDSTRTMIRPETRRVLLIVLNFAGAADIETVIQSFAAMLQQFTAAPSVNVSYVT
ncbi:MAG: phenylalanine--tRNA ligase beta subunit-related protein [Bacteroidota bacterium]